MSLTSSVLIKTNREVKFNVYYMDKVFFEVDSYNHKRIIEQIEGFSNIFCVDYTVESKYSEENFNEYSFFNPISYFKVGKPFATYVIYEDIKFKTPGDEVSDSMQKLESNVMIYNKDNQTLKKAYDSYEIKDHYTECKLVAKLNKNM